MKKQCALVYNKHASGFKEKKLPTIIETISMCGYNPVPIESKYAGYIIDEMESLNKEFDVILTLGGDGTVSEAYEAFHKINEPQQAIYGHIPGGTTNDMGPNTYLPRYNPIKATQSLLNGTIENREIITINDHPIAYVGATGVLAPVTYLINQSNDKKDAGTFSYIRYGASQIFTNRELFYNIVREPYEITYEANGRKVETEAVFIAIFNGRTFGNLNINKNANMCDRMFEVAIIPNGKELLKLIPQAMNPFGDGIIGLDDGTIFSTSHLKLTFENKTPFYPINCDGDPKELLTDTNSIVAKSSGKVLQLTGTRK